MTPALRPFLVVAIPLTLAACSSGGGGGGIAPVLTAAVFVGSTSAPAAGDTLQLVFDRDVATNGAVLDDDDVTLAPGGSLGSVSGGPSAVNARTIAVTLGSGVSFSPGSTTLALAEAFDAATGTDGAGVTGETAVTISDGDGDAPSITDLTLNTIDGVLNGTGAAGGTLQVPQHAFTIDLAFTDATSGVDASATHLSVDVPVSTTSGGQAAGTDLSGFFTLTTGSGTASFLVPTSVAFPDGPMTLTAFVTDSTGMTSAEATFAFRVRQYSDAVRPFETGVNPEQVWFLDTSRDLESYTANLSNTSTPIEVTKGANGRADLFDLFRIVGLHSASPISNVQSGKDSNQIVTERYETEILSRLTALYTGANASSTFDSPGTFPNSSSVPYDNASFSQICIAGAFDENGDSLVLGAAIFDLNNATQNDDCQTDFGSSGIRLGVFMHTAVNKNVLNTASSPFRQTFDPFMPARNGVPIGEQAGDDQRLTGSLTDTRTSRIDAAILGFANMTAAVTAHECGHSMGLVADGAMPTGLYGGMPSFFPGSTSGHIQNDSSLFPSGSSNVMKPGLSYSAAQHSLTAFNTLNEAYLLERALYDN